MSDFCELCDDPELCARERYCFELGVEAELLPGPAFIPATRSGRQPSTAGCGCLGCRHYHQVPDGYVFQPATDCTAAGWVRPHGRT